MKRTFIEWLRAGGRSKIFNFKNVKYVDITDPRRMIRTADGLYYG